MVFTVVVFAGFLLLRSVVFRYDMRRVLAWSMLVAIAACLGLFDLPGLRLQVFRFTTIALILFVFSCLIQVASSSLFAMCYMLRDKQSLLNSAFCIIITMDFGKVIGGLVISSLNYSIGNYWNLYLLCIIAALSTMILYLYKFNNSW